MRQYLPDESCEANSPSQLGVRDNTSRSWTYGDTAAHEHQAARGTWPGRGHKQWDPRTEFRGTGTLEANMAGVVVAVTIALFLAGVVVGVIAVVAVAVRREDRACSLVTDAPNRMSKSARKLNGLGCRDLDAELLPSARELVH